MDSALKKQIIEDWTDDLPPEQKIIRIFEKVRDIPYGNIGSRDAAEVYKQNKGTCSGKHKLLKELYQEIGVQVKDMLIMHSFRNLPVNYPPEIRKILKQSDFVDPHNFIQILVNKKWINVDATWDKALKKLGFIVNENWDGQSDMKITIVPGGEILESADSILFKKKLLAKLPTQVQKDRKIFLHKLTEWLDKLRAEKKI